METLPMKMQNKKAENRNQKPERIRKLSLLLLLLAVLISAFYFPISALSQEVVPGYTNRLYFNTTNSALYINGRLLWTTNAIAIPSNTIPWATNTTWGYGGGLMTWGVTGGTNYLFNSIGTNLWGRVAISTNF